MNLPKLSNSSFTDLAGFSRSNSEFLVWILGDRFLYPFCVVKERFVLQNDCSIVFSNVGIDGRLIHLKHNTNSYIFPPMNF